MKRIFDVSIRHKADPEEFPFRYLTKRREQGETFTYRFPVRQNGTYWYHSHTGLQEQLGHYGQRVRLRFANASTMTFYDIRIPGLPMTVVQADGQNIQPVETDELRIADDDDTKDHLGWEAQGWVGGDYNKFWWKHEGEAVFDGPDSGETETDLLYSRLVRPFWNFQAGVQYANEWDTDDYEDRWSGVLAFQGMAPYKFELDNALYVSEDGDVTFTCEAEYDVRITQRLVLQPLAELQFAFQDISKRDMGAGIPMSAA